MQLRFTFMVSSLVKVIIGEFFSFFFGLMICRYDGVAMLTQCPIPTSQKFTYSFVASEVGLRWYHGHGSGLKVDGLYGPSELTGNFLLFNVPSNCAR